MTRATIALLVPALLLTGCLCPPCPATPTPEPTATPLPWSIQWDSRLDALNVTIDWSDSTRRYWPIAAWITLDGNWEAVPAWAARYLVNFPEAGGDHHAFGRCLDAAGNVVPDKSFLLSWADGQDGRRPEPSGWANVPLFGGAYYPDRGEPGPYTWEALNGLPMQGLGLPYNQHYSFFVVWKARW